MCLSKSAGRATGLAVCLRGIENDVVAWLVIAGEVVAAAPDGELPGRRIRQYCLCTEVRSAQYHAVASQPAVASVS